MNYFCTYFDVNYLIRGLALYRSLMRWATPCTLYVLCMNDETYQILVSLKLPGLIPVLLSDFENSDIELVRVKSSRTLIEYYFTCTPALPIYLLKQNPEIEAIHYCDADMFLYSSFSSVLQTFKGKSIQLIPHCFPPAKLFAERSGKYNVGLVSFRRDVNGIAALEWWRKCCIEWCYDRWENGLYADQKYLDEMPGLFKNVSVVDSKGVFAAPWNIGLYRVHKVNGKVFVNDRELVVYHVEGVKALWSGVILFYSQRFFYRIPSSVKKLIYIPYIRELIKVNEELLSVGITIPMLHASRGFATTKVTSVIARVARMYTVVEYFLRGCIVIIKE